MSSKLDIHQTSMEKAIKQKAFERGFDVLEICNASHVSSSSSLSRRLNNFLDNQYHGSMKWMEERKEQRSNPKTLWPDVHSIIMLGMNYGPEENPLPQLEKKSKGVISVYAQNNDYHDIIKKKLKQTARWMIETYGGDVKVFVDTAPVMEKPLAQKAGLGWQGKHTNLVSRDYGSWLFIGSIFTTLELKAGTPTGDHCGSCSNCLDICPTQAFPAPYQLDARRCISYLTIEHKGSIPEEFRKPMGNRIYGCDDCLAVCPWNKYAQITKQEGFKPRDALATADLRVLLSLDDESFRALFRKSPIKRIGRNRFIRNVLIAAGNSNDQSLIPLVKVHQNDEDEIIVETAQWALHQLNSPAV